MKTLNCSEPILDIDTNCTVKQIYRCPDVSLNHIGIFISVDLYRALLLFRIKLLVIDTRMFAWTYAFYELVFSNYSLVLPTVDKKKTIHKQGMFVYCLYVLKSLWKRLTTPPMPFAFWWFCCKYLLVHGFSYQVFYCFMVMNHMIYLSPIE